MNKKLFNGLDFVMMIVIERWYKKICLYNEIPEGILYNEIQGFAPIIINGELSKIR